MRSTGGESCDVATAGRFGQPRAGAAVAEGMDSKASHWCDGRGEEVSHSVQQSGALRKEGACSAMGLAEQNSTAM